MNKKYEVYDGGVRIATDMDIDVAICLIKGYMEYHHDQTLTLTIQKASQSA